MSGKAKQRARTPWSALRRGRMVHDHWWPLDRGRIEWQGRTRLRVAFPGKVVRYDRSHATGFLVLE